MRNYKSTSFFWCISLMRLASYVVCYRVIAGSANWVKCFAESYREHFVEWQRCDHFTNKEPRLNITCKMKLIYATNSWISQWHNYSILVRISFHFIALNVSGHKYISTLCRHYTVLIYIQQDATLRSLFYMETAVHVSGGTSTHHHGIHHPQHTLTLSNSSTIAADSSNGVTNNRCCRYRCMCSWWWVEVPPETCRAVSRYK
jgi:hypothetical protein